MRQFVALVFFLGCGLVIAMAWFCTRPRHVAMQPKPVTCPACGGLGFTPVDNLPTDICSTRCGRCTGNGVVYNQ